MRQEYKSRGSAESEPLQFFTVIRGVGALLGMAIIMAGLICAVRVFWLVRSAMLDPSTVRESLQHWAEAVGGSQLDLVLDSGTIHTAQFIAPGILAVGAAILAWIAMGLIVAGAKTLSYTIGERQAIKRILTETFGAGRRAPGAEPPVRGSRAD